MSADKKSLIVPVIIITVGSGWLLTTLGIAPGINWVWTLGIAVAGVLMFIVSGWNKMTVVGGTLLIVASCLSLLRQTDRLSLDTEVPILVIVLGVLLLIARSRAIPAPDWVLDPPDLGAPK